MKAAGFRFHKESENQFVHQLMGDIQLTSASMKAARQSAKYLGAGREVADTLRVGSGRARGGPDILGTDKGMTVLGARSFKRTRPTPSLRPARGRRRARRNVGDATSAGSVTTLSWCGLMNRPERISTFRDAVWNKLLEELA